MFPSFFYAPLVSASPRLRASAPPRETGFRIKSHDLRHRRSKKSNFPLDIRLMTTYIANLGNSDYRLPRREQALVRDPAPGGQPMWTTAPDGATAPHPCGN